jgi:hypothetical protein
MGARGMEHAGIEWNEKGQFRPVSWENVNCVECSGSFWDDQIGLENRYGW